MKRQFKFIAALLILISNNSLAADFNSMLSNARNLALSSTSPANAEVISSCGSTNGIATSYTKISGMAKKWSATEDAGQKSQILNTINSNLQFLKSKCYRAGFSSSKWWYENEVIAPLKLTNALLILGSSVDSSEYAKDAYAWASNRFAKYHTHANLSSVAYPMLNAALILKDESKMNSLFSGTTDIRPRLISISKGNSFLQDGSFDYHAIMHTDYGAALMSNIANISKITSGTNFEFSAAQYDTIFKRFFDAFEPVMFGKQVMDFSRGRTLTVKYGNNLGNWLLTSLNSLSGKASDKYKSKISSFLKDFGMNKDKSVLARGGLEAFVDYPEQSKAVFHKKDYAFGLSMNSAWKHSFEGQDSQNFEAWYTSEGRLEFHNKRDIDQYNDNWWATIDRKRLPGTTTVNQELPKIRCDTRKNDKNTFVGSANLFKLYGVSAYSQSLQVAEGEKIAKSPHYAPTCAYVSSPIRVAKLNLTSKKSYFFFDDEIVLLGSNINGSNAGNTETTIENKRFKSNPELTVDGEIVNAAYSEQISKSDIRWAHLKSDNNSEMGYYFPSKNQQINILRETRSGNWKDTTAKPMNNSIHKRNFQTNWFDHGKTPNNQKYSFVLLPNKNKEYVSSYSASPDVSIIRMDDTAHAVKDKSTGIESAVFWKAGKAGNITSDNPVNIVTLRKDKKLYVSVADPDLINGNNKTIKLNINANVKGINNKHDRITVSSLSPLILDVNVSTVKNKVGEPLGASWQAVFDLK